MRTFGKYRLIEPLASGGMADVWRAEVTLAAGVVKEVALKLVRGEHQARDDFVRMFVEEARLACLLSHANVVQVFEFDQIDGQYYLAMELVRGRHLGRVVERTRELGLRMGLPRTVHVIAEAAKALAYVHRVSEGGRPLGLVHRDVSPHNLLVSLEGEVKLADFGIARAMTLAGLTEPGTLKGKIAYMAPEQAAGEPVDARADVFSLGVILWELCAGRRLFARDSEAATLAAVVSGLPPSAPSGWNEAVPAELDAIVLGALERDPARRTASAEEMEHRLSALLLRIAQSPHDWDLRAFMHRLWPEGATPPPAERTEKTLVRFSPEDPASSPPPPAPPPTTAETTAPTRTLTPEPAARRRRAFSAAAVGLVAALAVGALVRWWPGDASVPAVPRDEVAAPASSSATARAEAPPAPAPPPAASPAPIPAAGAHPQDPEPGLAVVPEPGRGAPDDAPRGDPGVDQRPGSLYVNATPWASIIVDGRAVGETPQTLTLAPGRHHVRAAHPKYGRRDAVVLIMPGAHQSWTPNLQRD